VRVVIYTNVLISAIFWTGRTKRILNRVRQGSIIFLTSSDLLKELFEVLVRSDKPFQLSSEEASRVVTELTKVAEVVETTSLVNACRHAVDNRVLECAVDGHADCVVTGDRHLLDLRAFQDVPIISVSGFLKSQ
jgi:uncharacterized protein